MRYHAERGNDQKPRSYRDCVNLTVLLLLLICFWTSMAQTPQNATWVQAERRWRAVGRAAGMPLERRQGMDARSARAHGASPK